MDTISATLVILMAGVLLLLLLVGLAICLGYVNVTHVWVSQEEQTTSVPEPVQQMRLQSRNTQRAMDEETEQYLEEMYRTHLSTAETEYRLPTMSAPAKERHNQPTNHQEPLHWEEENFVWQ